MAIITGLTLDCVKTSARKDDTEAPGSPALSGRVSVEPGALTPVGSNIVTPFEMAYYYGPPENGSEPPQLYYRSNMAEAPFPLPEPGDKWFKVPAKDIESAFDKVLTRKVWAIVAPKVIAVFKRRGIRYASLTMVRFSTPDEATGKRTLGPLVVWIATYPGTTSPAQAQEASPEILEVFEHHGVSGVVAEFYEATIERLGGRHLMHNVDETSARPTETR
ncbi:hypothetical protein D9619_000193 [Psilocybe cf. subviscida]|uniref:Uncharacterized protein n=1 Tax=Psilocybe cf. subviscida TaxID=2480587 RepID=A0A8H5BDM6_9AGAR|nr:hypothetical protein D9619_000193 [Psilocybe cf. subviscida]